MHDLGSEMSSFWGMTLYNAIESDTLYTIWQVSVKSYFRLFRKPNINKFGKNKTDMEYMIQYSWNSNSEWEHQEKKKIKAIKQEIPMQSKQKAE